MNNNFYLKVKSLADKNNYKLKVFNDYCLLLSVDNPDDYYNSLIPAVNRLKGVHYEYNYNCYCCYLYLFNDWLAEIESNTKKHQLTDLFFTVFAETGSQETATQEVYNYALSIDAIKEFNKIYS